MVEATLDVDMCEHEPILNHGEYTCTKCGLVLGPQFTPPYVSSACSADFPASTHCVELPKFGNPNALGSSIGAVKVGLRTTPSEFAHNKRLAKLDRMYNTSTRMKFNRAAWVMMNVALRLELPKSVPDRAFYLFWTVVNSKTLGKITNSYKLGATCLYQAIKERQHPTSIKELTETYSGFGHRMKPTFITHTMLRLKPLFPALFLHQVYSSSKRFFRKMISKLFEDQRVKMKFRARGIEIRASQQALWRAAVGLLDETDAIRGEKHPYVYAAATLYYTAEMLRAKSHAPIPIISQGDFSRILDVSPVSLRRHYYFLKHELNYLPVRGMRRRGTS